MRSEMLTPQQAQGLSDECGELSRIINASIQTAKANQKKQN